MRLKAFKVTGPHAPKISVWDVDGLDCKAYRENYDKIDWGVGMVVKDSMEGVSIPELWREETESLRGNGLLESYRPKSTLSESRRRWNRIKAKINRLKRLICRCDNCENSD